MPGRGAPLPHLAEPGRYHRVVGTGDPAQHPGRQPAIPADAQLPSTRTVSRPRPPSSTPAISTRRRSRISCGAWRRMPPGRWTPPRASSPVPLGSKIEPLNIKLTDSPVHRAAQAQRPPDRGGLRRQAQPGQRLREVLLCQPEAQQLAFLTDTLLWILKGYEEELSWKLLATAQMDRGEAAQFNTAVMLRRADTKTQIESMVQAVANSVYMPNEARAYLGMSSARRRRPPDCQRKRHPPWRTWGSSMEIERSDGIMDAIQKAARVEKQALAGEALALINRQALKELTEEEVFVFRWPPATKPGGPGAGAVHRGGPGPAGRAVCGEDRDHGSQVVGQRPDGGSPGPWRSRRECGGWCCGPTCSANDQTAPLIAAIEGGILREVSVGCQVAKAICSICGTDRRETYCGHCPGQGV